MSKSDGSSSVDSTVEVFGVAAEVWDYYCDRICTAWYSIGTKK